MVTNDFIKKIIRKKKDEIIGLYISKYGQFKTKKSAFDLNYIIALFIIAGPIESIKQLFKVLSMKINGSESLVEYAKKEDIRVYRWKSLNSEQAIKKLKELKPDIIIHQTQEILNKDFISIPSICILNRHNSLLPKYRGRLASFWTLYNGEKETGVTIHTVTEKIDYGQNILQKKIRINKNDDYVSLTKKCYEIAPDLMIEAIDLVKDALPKKEEETEKGSYYPTPTIKDAIEYRKRLRERRKGVKR